MQGCPANVSVPLGSSLCHRSVSATHYWFSSVLTILFSTPSVKGLLICGDSSIWLMNLNLTWDTGDCFKKWSVTFISEKNQLVSFACSSVCVDASEIPFSDAGIVFLYWFRLGFTEIDMLCDNSIVGGYTLSLNI